MTAMQTPLIQFDNVYKAFGANEVLKGIFLDIFAGQVTTIIGKSGIGKSVLLKHIIGLMEPDSGRILFEGLPLTGTDGSRRKTFKAKCSYMFQSTALFDSMTVVENIALPLKERRLAKKTEIAERVRAKTEQLDLSGIENSYPSQLSGGMRKRVALARALVTEPEIVLFDEPTTGLDPLRKNAVHRIIADYQQRFGFTAVLVSHDIPDVLGISQRVAMLDQGRIIFQGSRREIQSSSEPAIRAFIHGRSNEEETP